MRIARISENAFWVVTPERVRRNSRIPDTTEDDWIIEAIESAHEYIEEYLGCCIAMADYRMTLDRFPRKRGSIDLPVWPVKEVANVQYVDPTGAVKSIELDKIVQPSDNGRFTLRLKDHELFPSTRATPNAVTITFTAGWSEVEKVPKTLRRAALMLTSHWYENRETVLIGTISKEIEHGTVAMLEQLRPPEDYTAGEVCE